jgi:serine phosphatase RsbU (regulator of sigma subunit)
MSALKATLTIRTPGEPARDHVLHPGHSYTIGRGPWNSVQLNSATASRNHARIAHRGGAWWVEDLGSHNGTTVNGVRVSGATELSPGDRVGIGQCDLSFREGTESTPAPMIEPSATVGIQTMSLKGILESEEGLDTESVAAPSKVGPELLQKMDRIGSALIGHYSLSELFDRIMDLVVEVLEPAHTALLVPDETGGGLSIAATPRSASGSREILLSRTIARRAFNSREAILIRDAPHDERLHEQESVIRQHIESALCAPLWDDEEVLGLLYADRRFGQEHYGDEDLSLLVLLGHLAAVKIRETKALDRLQQRARVEEELKRAVEIQRLLLPAKPLVAESVSLAGRCIPCLGVGGDYFDYIEGAGGRITLALGDVSGKGMSAALLMAAIHAKVQAYEEAGLPLPVETSRINRTLHSELRGERMVTLFLARLDPATGRLEYVNAGHNPPFLLSGTGEMTELSTGDPLLGPFSDAEYHVRTVELPPGGTLLLYSDGVTEAEDPGEAQFGEERLRESLRRHRNLPPGELLERLIDDIRDFTHPEEPQDDVTLVVAKRG